MSAKNLGRHNRWRNITVAFRVSPEEDKEIETTVRLSGLTKQDYITRGPLMMQKKKRTALEATMDVVGQDRRTRSST